MDLMMIAGNEASYFWFQRVMLWDGPGSGCSGGGVPVDDAGRPHGVDAAADGGRQRPVQELL